MHKIYSFLFLNLLILVAPAASQELQIRKRLIDSTHPEQPRTVYKDERWAPAETAVIVCDMWDAHHCFNAVQRVNEMAPRMDAFLKKLRAQGATIIHAPSSCVDFYKEHPARANVKKVPRSTSIPKGIGQWCDHIPAELEYPLDQSDGGEDDDPEAHQRWAKELQSRGRNPRAPWKRQVASLKILDQDFVTDNGEEVWSILDHRKIGNVMLVGVHTNMCVLGRPFGLRQLAKNGKNVVLVRDLTDSMYNPARWPFVDHYQGNRLIQRHIEKYVCGTITSNQILGGQEFRFKNDRPPKCVVVCAESLYGTEKTLKSFAERVIRDKLGFETRILTSQKNEHKVDGLVEALSEADLVVLSVRRRSLPQTQLAGLRAYLKKGKPLVAIRTSSHAFDTHDKHPEGHAEWPRFDIEVLGCDYTGHHANGIRCQVSRAPASELNAKIHPILTDVKISASEGSLYKSNPLGPRCTPLLMGKVENKPAEPIAWTNHYKKSKVFYTSLGSETDFKNRGFRQLLENGVRWATNMKIGTEPSRKK